MSINMVCLCCHYFDCFCENSIIVFMIILLLLTSLFIIITCISCRPIQQRERQLVDMGPTWRTPSVAGVLRNLPFMRHSPPQVLEVNPAPLTLARLASSYTIRSTRLHICLSPKPNASSAVVPESVCYIMKGTAKSASQSCSQEVLNNQTKE